MAAGTALLVIDPQVDFCDPNGALPVPGADEDMRRLAAMVHRLRDSIDTIHVTLDSHHPVHIAKPVFWVDAAGNHPAPFTTIEAAEVVSGRWTATRREHRDRAREYVEALERNGRYRLTIWPPHCLIGSAGHAVAPDLFDALCAWQCERFRVVEYVAKGSNPYTEHYSAVRADVPDPDDPATGINHALIEALERADRVLVAGEALTHCVANTVGDIVDGFADPGSASRLVLLTDAMSGIPGFEEFGSGFLERMRGLGVATLTTDAVER